MLTFKRLGKVWVRMEGILICFLIASCSTIIIWVLQFVLECIKEDKEYAKSLFKQLKDIDYCSDNHTEKVLTDFKDIKKKILKLDSNYSVQQTNMQLIDSLAEHEIIALRTIADALKTGVPITDETIIEALIEVVAGLNRHYKEFCRLQTANVQHETFILRKVQQNEADRLEFEKQLKNESEVLKNGSSQANARTFETD